jgi:hypothetical protein
MSVPTGTEVDALFKLPLGEFTSARNTLATELRKAGRRAEATETKALAKPSVSAWVVNQLYWRHRGLFDRLIEAGDRMRHAQAAQKAVDSTRDPAKARRETVTALSKIAEGLLLGGNYGATRDVLRRVTTTLEALSSYGSLPNAPSAGRLTDDVEPPGFGTLVGIPSAGKKRLGREPAARRRSPLVALAAKPTRADQRAATRAEQERRRRLAATKAAVRDAERALTVVRKQAERAAARLDAAVAEANDATAAVASAERTLESARQRLQQMDS